MPPRAPHAVNLRPATFRAACPGAGSAARETQIQGPRNPETQTTGPQIQRTPAAPWWRGQRPDGLGSHAPRLINQLAGGSLSLNFQCSGWGVAAWTLPFEGCDWDSRGRRQWRPANAALQAHER